ncbi:MAG: DUF547 domain-containing protein [Deltaproteobacteria bacterium]|nr:MAG: DUF547 domain-containing protein [Deltaproteobacteria bacterium]
MLIALLTLACGQYIDAADADALCADGDTNFSAEVSVAGRDALTDATRLGHYGLTGLLVSHTYDETWNGGTVRSVDYTAMNRTPDAGVTLGDTLANMASVDPLALDGHEEALAFWLNLYNAWAIQTALNQLAADPDWAGASASTWNGEETGATFVMFTTRFVTVDGVQLSLNEVEHGVIRGDFDPSTYDDEPALLDRIEAWHAGLWGDDPVDARIHMGLNCVSRSCPDVPARAFTADNVYATLDDNATRFLAHTAKGAGPDGISILFSWFRGDFETSFGSVQDFVRTYRESGDADVNYDATLDYDWSLNGA